MGAGAKDLHALAEDFLFAQFKRCSGPGDLGNEFILQRHGEKLLFFESSTVHPNAVAFIAWRMRVVENSTSIHRTGPRAIAWGGRTLDQFEGRTAVITGAASGIGRALAARCAGLAMNVVLVDVEARALEAEAQRLETEGHRVMAVPTDVRQADQVSALALRVEERFGDVHLLCNNAGVFTGGSCWEAPLVDYEWVFGVNVWGVVHALRSFIPGMLAHGEEAHVVNTASMAAVTATPFTAPYSMSKAAVFSLSETLFLEMQSRGGTIGVSVLCPELVNTAIGRSDRNRPDHLERKPEDVGSPEQALVEEAIVSSTATGLDPDVLAARTLDAVEARRFYVLAAEGDPWRIACDARLDDIRAARNPGSLPVPGA